MARSLLNILIEIVISSSVLILGLLLLSKVFKGKINPRLQYALWALVAVRLLVPISIHSAISITNTVPVIKNIQQQIITTPIKSAITPINISTQVKSKPVIEDVSVANAVASISQSKCINYTPTQVGLTELMSLSRVEEKKVKINIYNEILLLYCTCVLVVFTYLLCINLRFNRSIKKSARLLEPNEVINHAFHIAMVKKNIPIYLSEHIPSPCLTGVFQNRIYITPASLESDMVLSHVLLHELCHYKQRDNISGLVRNICCALYWFNPLVFLAAKYHRKDCELACDALVLSKIAKEEQLDYGNTLIVLLRKKSTKLGLLYSATTMTGKKNDMKERIKMICKKPKSKPLTVIALILCLMPVMIWGCTANKTTSSSVKPIATEKPHKDLNGRVIRILNYGMEGTPEDLYAHSDSTLDQLELKKIQEIESDNNCKFQFVKMDDSSCASINAGENLGDLIMSENPMLFYLMRDNIDIFDPLDKYSDILDLNNTLLWDTKKQLQLSLGKVTQVVNPNTSSETFLQNNVLFFNISMMKKAGLWNQYNLYEMQKNKTWNWAVFQELCKKFKSYDTSKKGIYFTYNVLSDFMVSNGNGDGKSSLVKINPSGNAVFAINESAQKATYDFFSSLSKAGCLGYAPEDDSFTIGYKSFIKGETLFDMESGSAIYKLKKDMKDEWGVVAIPMGPNNTNKEYRINNIVSPAMGIEMNAPNKNDLAFILKLYMEPTLPVDQKIEINVNAMKEAGLDDNIIDTYKMLTNPDLSSIDYTWLFAGAGSTYPYFQEITKVFQGSEKESDFFQKTVPQINGSVNNLWQSIVRNINWLVKREAENANKTAQPTQTAAD